MTKLPNLRRTVTTSLLTADTEPLRALVKVGILKIAAKSYDRPPASTLTWRWEIWRRGFKKAKSVPIHIGQKWSRKKWPKRRTTQMLVGVVKAVYNLGFGTVTTVLIVNDRGPRFAHGNRKRYVVSRSTIPASARTVIGRFGSRQIREFKSIANAKAHVRSEVNSLKQLKLRAPSYIVVRPGESIESTKHRQGFSSLTLARADLVRRRGNHLKELAEMDRHVRAMKREMNKPDPTLRSVNALSYKFRRTKKSYKSKNMRVDIHGYTKRVDAEPRALSEALAFRVVRWFTRPPGAKKGRWQSVIFSLTRWGRTFKGGSAYAPSYTVADPDGKDIAYASFAAKTISDPNDPVSQELVRQESFDKVVYTKRPLAQAHAELERQTMKWVKMLLGVHKIEDRPWMKVARGEGTEVIGKYRVKVVKWGLKKDYPPITQTDRYSSIGGVEIQVYRKGSRKPLREIRFELLRPRVLKERQQRGAVMLMRQGDYVRGYRSAQLARNALRRLVIETTTAIRQE